MNPNIARATRDITGPTGWVWSNAWDKLDQHGEAYMKSFDPKIPPSIFVSERDRTRHGQPMPIVERCIEDWPHRNTDSGPAPAVETESPVLPVAVVPPTDAAT